MKSLREKPIEFMGEYKVVRQRDYEQGINGLPKSNVLYYELENDSWCCIRPSGTEPKIKFYVGVKGKTMEEAEKQIEKLQQYAKQLI